MNGMEKNKDDGKFGYAEVMIIKNWFGMKN